MCLAINPVPQGRFRQPSLTTNQIPGILAINPVPQGRFRRVISKVRIYKLSYLQLTQSLKVGFAGKAPLRIEFLSSTLQLTQSPKVGFAIADQHCKLMILELAINPVPQGRFRL